MKVPIQLTYTTHGSEHVFAGKQKVKKVIQSKSKTTEYFDGSKPLDWKRATSVKSLTAFKWSSGVESKWADRSTTRGHWFLRPGLMEPHWAPVEDEVE